MTGKHTSEKPAPVVATKAAAPPSPLVASAIPASKPKCIRCSQGFFCADHAPLPGQSSTPATCHLPPANHMESVAHEARMKGNGHLVENCSPFTAYLCLWHEHKAHIRPTPSSLLVCERVHPPFRSTPRCVCQATGQCGGCWPHGCDPRSTKAEGCVGRASVCAQRVWGQFQRDDEQRHRVQVPPGPTRLPRQIKRGEKRAT